MGAKLKNPPVYFTVAQVRFNPILKLSEFLPSIQESFRLAHYPAFDVNTVTAIKVNLKDKQAVPTPEAHDRYVFANAAKTHGFILDQSSLTLQSTDYGDFPSFSGEFLQGLKRIHAVVELAFSERVGLRYLDRIIPLDGDDLAKYLVPEALGLRAKLDGAPVHSLTETLIAQNGLKLVSRALVLSSPIVFPPDLMPLGLEVAQRFTAYTGLHAVLDNDGFFEARENFSTDTVRDHLTAIHTMIGGAFRAVATPYAFEKWDK